MMPHSLRRIQHAVLTTGWNILFHFLETSSVIFGRTKCADNFLDRTDEVRRLLAGNDTPRCHLRVLETWQ
jgi:hypothetical protein